MYPPFLDLEYWINNSTKQGLPPEHAQRTLFQHMNYTSPEPEIISAGFFAVGPDLFWLHCAWSPESIESNCGVRPCVEKEQIGSFRELTKTPF
ncbi:hypothetical protein CL616_00815 [archaeon]|nr:hypothetical protein [archaeon]|tara:strand:+ start:1180 stop:1458 length:279 start_codon:yes stop_codon:yes gene_type:complete